MEEIYEKRRAKRTVDVLVNPFVELVNLRPEFFGIIVELLLIRRDQVVKGGVKDSDNLGALVVDNGPCLLVP